MKEYIKIINKEKKAIEMKINYGIQLLRTILSYLILQYHCFDINLTKNKILRKSIQAIGFYVPTFYIISYYFSYKTFKCKNINNIKLRLERFIIPYIIYTFLFYVINNLIYYNNRRFTIKDLFFQFISGIGIYTAFWFLCNLIFTFIFFSIIVLIFEKNVLFIIKLSGVFGYLCNNYIFYNDLFVSYKLKFRTLFLNFTKVLIYGAISISIASINEINELKRNCKKNIFFSLFIMYVIRDYDIIIKEFYYLREIILGFTSASIFILFLIIPLDNINTKIKQIIIIITKYSGGIYYLHIQLWRILRIKYIIIKNKELSGCWILFLICYYICFLGTKIFGKTKFKYLFN